MNITMDVPDEFIDSIVEEALVSSYHSTKKELAALKKLKKPKEHQLEDIEDMTKYLAALELVGNWFVWQFREKVGIK
jgi:predicted nucleic acid-binding protein